MKRHLIDEQSFILAYDTYADPLFRYCYFRVYDRERARELVQETFMKTWEYARAGNEIENMRAFLYKVARNLSINEGMRHKALSLDEMHETVGFDPKDEKQVSPEREAEGKLVMERLAKLPEGDREALTLRYVDGLQVKEIAALLNEEANTVSVRIHRALAKLKEHSGIL